MTLSHALSSEEGAGLTDESILRERLDAKGWRIDRREVSCNCTNVQIQSSKLCLGSNIIVPHVSMQCDSYSKE